MAAKTKSKTKPSSKNSASKKASRSKAAPKTAKKASKKAAAKSGTGKAKKPLRKSPTTEVDEEVLDFIAALDEYKKEQNRPFPNWSEVLLVLKRLGYRKTEK